MNGIASTKSPAFSLNAIALQRLEGLVALGFGVAAYAWLGQSWLVFGLLFLAPDLFMLGYLRSARVGAMTYNLAHTYVAPALLALLGLFVGPLAFGLAAIWVAHIGFDRMLGYGLKLNGGFEQTHLGLIGKARRK
ncbi:hypothetical protein ASD83_16400 [Devosia sp. Root685]|uniref:DUF4260 domain-containing protein n=1 Tax=Devosia sp. Root685 TaxID=1736587 RepID=UPI0006F54934|nr:DUF4260 domain-containing protein [Devosia sp. Root685]KRA96879.1 hypothetical protein ASD83_16400 [Devosia sp. Root685]